MPTVPLALVGLVMTGAAGLIVSDKLVLPVPPAFVALMVTLGLPAAVGVPEMTPVEVLTVRPAGKFVAPKLVGEFDAVIW